MPALLKQQGLLSRCVLRAMLGWLVTSDPCHGPLTDLVFLPGSQPDLYTAAQNDGFCGCFFQGLRDGRKSWLPRLRHCIASAQLARYQTWGITPRTQRATLFFSFFQRVDGLAHSPSSFVRHGCMLTWCGYSPRG